ncbi:hypothetical protein SAMN05216480_102250 [Pustulibacterium marinum]|uniref:Uncharacterized protein n=1 Tax=Pustulibacterium marinum TaxID=1224947 RepID=A0A1I7FUH9_9FLAO|nr:hypothetical protein [Pustulibacterium marinum]SFU39884.1 hypothetical protein SAMN05216480_102250 [Pustulibacterium marinum]
MTDEFIPPIKERTTDDLLKIVGAPDKWNPRAVFLANNELINRKVEPKKIQTAKYLSKKREKVEERIKANESYQFCDFFFNPFWTLFEIIFSWELKKDGFIRKAKQQKYFRIGIGILILICIGLSYMT